MTDTVTPDDEASGSIQSLPQELEDIIDASEELPEAQREVVRDAVFRLAAMQLSVSESFTSPLPPPRVMRDYEDIHPGAFDRILTLSEVQLAHRQARETQVITADVWQAYLGLLLGFIVTMTAIVGGIQLLAAGRDISGFVLVLAPLVTLSGTFVYAYRRRQEERAARLKELTRPTRKPELSDVKAPTDTIQQTK